MANEITGRLMQVLPEQSGQGQNGPWLKQIFIIETQEQYSKKIAFICWNDKAEILKQLKPGDELRVSFSLESREFNGRWYTDAKAFRIEALSGAGRTSPSDFAPAREMNYSEAPPDIKDDLPF